MKKIQTLTLTLAIGLCALTGCANASAPEVEPEPQVAEPAIESTTYFTQGRYYFNADLLGEVVTEDGNVWGYTQDIISDEPSYHNEPVFVCFNDNGTPDDIYDDEIIGLVLDRETAIYDELELVLSESFELERDGNNIRIQSMKVVD